MPKNWKISDFVKLSNGEIAVVAAVEHFPRLTVPVMLKVIKLSGEVVSIPADSAVRA